MLLLLGAAPRDALASGQTLRDVVFTEYAGLASNAELARRLLSPLEMARVEKQSGTIAGRPVNLADERFIVYLPEQRPPGGYGLLVFVPPWQDARVPNGWPAALDRSGVIFVSAARSGNSEIVGRREPLALLAADNITRQYPVDPARVYIGGFSGGARIALRLALAYPDVFHGALLNAGSDPIGGPEIPLPPADLFLKFQTSTHMVYVTGDLDTTRASDDLVSVRALHQWCVFRVDSYVVPRLGHEVAPPESLSWALGRLFRGVPPDPARLASCRSRIEAELATGLGEVESLIENGRRAEAEKRLKKVDERYGGLAAPRSA